MMTCRCNPTWEGPCCRGCRSSSFSAGRLGMSMKARGSMGAGTAPDLAPPLLFREEALLSPTMKCLMHPQALRW